MSKPTILLVGGAWHTADYLKPLAAMLEAAGCPTSTIGLPSVGAKLTHLDFEDDVAVIRSTAARLIGEHKRIVAVFHSYGGVAGTKPFEASITEREGHSLIMEAVF